MEGLKPLSKKDIIQEYRSLIGIQDYSEKKKIEGVEIYELKNFVGEDGFLCEIVRLNKGGYLEAIKDFKVLQINYSEAFPGVIKAWHLHLSQEDLWYVSPNQTVLVGLYDLRKDSPTRKIFMRFALGGGKSQLLYIPRGVAHGYANLTDQPISLIYFVNQKFDPASPDEYRLPWDLLGEDFWKMTPG
jgi:dTDP-4-dehydrorhamnose 3,5-epimerase